jgi:hypothetical protein
MTGPSSASTPGWGHVVDDAVHRAIVVVDIAESTAPIRRNSDRVLIRQTMYQSLTSAFRRRDWVKCYYEDRGDGVLLLVHPRVPKGWLVTVLPEKLEEALIQHNAAMAQQNPPGGRLLRCGYESRSTRARSRSTGTVSWVRPSTTLSGYPWP